MSVWQHLGAGLLLGCGLGLLYGFLRPFRPRWLGDLLWILALFPSWLFLGFGLCGGDLRMGYTASLAAGALVWDALFGQILHPVFACFWQEFYRLWALVLHLPEKILKKLRKFLIFLFARSKKWVTIKCNQHLPGGAENRRNTHGIP